MSGFDVATLRAGIAYDPGTGLFHWLRLHRGPLKTPRLAGTLRRDGYLQISFQKKLFLAHRLAWFYVHGQFPEAEIDHVNGDKADNRICNLRAALRCENLANRPVLSSSRNGIRGVLLMRRNRCKLWRAWVTRNGQRIYSRCFETAEEAAIAHEAMAREAYGDFAYAARLRARLDGGAA